MTNTLIETLNNAPRFFNADIKTIKEKCDCLIPAKEELDYLLLGDETDKQVHDLYYLLRNKSTSNTWNLENLNDDYIRECINRNTYPYNFDLYVRYGIYWLSKHSQHWNNWNIADERVFYLFARRLTRQYKGLAEYKFLEYLKEYYPTAFYCDDRTLDTVFGIDFLINDNNKLLYLHIVESTPNAFKLLNIKGRYGYSGYCRDKEKGIEYQEYKHVRGFADITELNLNQHTWITFRTKGQEFIFDNIDLLYSNYVSVKNLNDLGFYFDYYLPIAREQDAKGFLPATYKFKPVAELEQIKVA